MTPGVYKYTEQIQLKILAMFWLNRESYSLYQDVIKPTYFNKTMHADICRVIFNYREQYKNTPSKDALIEEVIDECERTAKKTALIKDYIQCVEQMAILEIPDAEYIQDKIVSFGKRQALSLAVQKSAEILDREPETKYEDIANLVKDALLVGENTTDLGIDLFENIEERFNSYTVEDDVIERIPTGVEILDNVLNGGLGRTELGVVVAAPGRGKALHPDTPVLTPTGYKPIKTLECGDSVITYNGTVTNVTGVYRHKSKSMYRLKIIGCSDVICCDEHLWYARKIHELEYHTVELKQMLADLQSGECYCIPRMKSLANLKIHDEFCPVFPYTLGRYLSNKLVNSLIDTGLQELEITEDNLHIPKQYLFAGVHNREGLLDGIMSPNPHRSEFKTTSKQLAEDVKFLAEGLGVWASPIIQKDNQYCLVLDKTAGSEYYITQAEYIGEQPAVCISVEHPSELYVIQDGIVTHNTTTLISIGAAAIEEGYNVLHISLENNEKQIARNYDVRLLKKNKEFIKSHLDQSILAMNNIKKYRKGQLRIKKYPTKTATIKTIRALLDKYKTVQNFVPDIMILDYGALLKPVQNYLDKRNAIESIFEDIRALADEYNLAIWSAAQGNRGALSKKLVTMGDLAECFAIGNIADVMVCLCQTMKEKIAGKLRLYLPKIRDNADTMVMEGSIQYDIKKIEMNNIVENIDDGEDEKADQGSW